MAHVINYFNHRARFSCILWYRKLVKRSVTLSLIEHRNVNLHVSTIRLKLWPLGWWWHRAFWRLLLHPTESKMERWESVAASERINGSHYMVLTVWPGHRVMDAPWQVMVLCCLRLSKRRWWTQLLSLVNNSSWLHLGQQPLVMPEGWDVGTEMELFKCCRNILGNSGCCGSFQLHHQCQEKWEEIKASMGAWCSCGGELRM